MKKIVYLLLLFMVMSPYVSAEKKIFYGTGEYTMSDYETPAVAEQRALAYAKQRAAEQAGVYVDTYTKMEKVQVTEDRVNVLVSGAMRITAQNTQKTELPTGDIRIVANITAEVDSGELEQLLANKNKAGVDSDSLYRQLKEKIENEERETKALKKKIEELKSLELPLEDARLDMKRKEQEFQSNQKIEEAGELFERGDYQRALALADEGVKLNSKNGVAYAMRAACNGKMGDYGSCIVDCNRCLLITPGLGWAYNTRGAAYGKKREYEKAEHDFNKAIELFPQYSMAYHNRGITYRIKKEFRKSIGDYNQALVYDSRNADIYLDRGLSYMGLNDYDMAISDFMSALSIDPKLNDGYERLVLCYMNKNDYNNAIKYASKGISFNMNSAGLYAFRGLAYEGIGKLDLAIADVKKSIDINPNDGQLREVLKELYRKRNR